MIIHHKQDGFGLMELLVVISAVGLLSSLVVFVSGTYQSRIRDARRISDITQIRQGLELFYTQAAGYPDTRVWTAGNEIDCSENKIIAVPHDPAPWLYYSYKSAGKVSPNKSCGNQTVWSSYKIQFDTETDSVLGPPGIYCLRPVQGIIPGECPSV